MKKFITLSLLSLVALSAMAENIKTIVYTPNPVMTCENCEKKIKTNVRFVKGTKRIDTSLKDQTVTITYDADKAKPEDFVAAFAKIGRQVTEVTTADKKPAKELKKVEKQVVLKADQQVLKTADKEIKKADKEIKKADKQAVKIEKAAVNGAKKIEATELKTDKKPAKAMKK